MPLPRSRLEATAYLPGKAFNQMSADWQRDFAALRPKPGEVFDTEQKEMLKGWYLVVPSAIASQLAAAQEGKTIRIEPVTSPTGTLVISADSLTDSRDGENYGHLRSLLAQCPFAEIPDSAWPVPQIMGTVTGTVDSVVKKIL